MSDARFDPDFTLLDETEDYLVVDKPAPLQVHPKVPGGPPTLWDGLKNLLAFELANGGQVSIINRLDRETSGVTLVAKHAAAARTFGIAMMQRAFHKTYHAIVLGWPDWESIDVDAPIRRKGEFTDSPIWVKQIVHPEGAPCQTHFRLLKKTTFCGQNIALVEARPITGRMHQLRVHLAHLGHPILGDKIYGPDETCYLDFIETGWTPDLQRRLHLDRQALHASELRIDTPALTRSWTAPMPPALADILPAAR